MTQKVVIEVTLNGQNSSYQRGIIEMFLKFMFCKDEELDRAMRIRIKAKKIAVSIPGVESVAMEGEERNILTVIGDGIDPARLVRLLQKKVCFAKMVSFGPNQTNPEPEPTPTPTPLPVAPISCSHSPRWQIVEIRNVPPASTFECFWCELVKQEK